jgi:hypothetical protein
VKQEFEKEQMLAVDSILESRLRKSGSIQHHARAQRLSERPSVQPASAVHSRSSREIRIVRSGVVRTQVLDHFFKRGKMLKIQRSSNGQVVFTVIGQMDEEDIGELEVLLRSEMRDRRIVLDLKDLTLADRAAINFLGCCEEGGIALENCAVYVREWITRERRRS